MFMVVGESATFKCHFDMEGEMLYSLKWWKDEHQFFQYIPRNNPMMVVFEVPGVHVDVSKLNFFLKYQNFLIKNLSYKTCF